MTSPVRLTGLITKVDTHNTMSVHENYLTLDL